MNALMTRQSIWRVSRQKKASGIRRMLFCWRHRAKISRPARNKQWPRSLKRHPPRHAALNAFSLFLTCSHLGFHHMLLRIGFLPGFAIVVFTTILSLRAAATVLQW
jgi:hypothetical protein